MKHAILIMAHKNYSFLHHLIEYFERDCYVFVHIDKKSDITKEEIACLREMPQVAGVYQKYSVHWGGFSILKCELFMLKDALKKCDADYFHLISGQDYPIKPLSYFLTYFEENNGTNYLTYSHLPNPRWEQNTYERFQYFYLFDYFSRRDMAIHYSNKIMEFQKRYHLKRRIPDYFDHLYGGSQWFSITRKSVDTFLNFTKRKPSFYNKLRFTFAPEETYFTTLGVNLLLKEKVKVENKNCRFIRWKNENGNYPANLSLEHFHFFAEEDALFARKFDGEIGEKAVEAIDEYLIKNSPLKISKNGGWIYDGYQNYNYDEDVVSLLYSFCKTHKVNSVVDIGCGAGLYVAALRRLKIPVAGYDANPYTPSLSSRLLPFGDEPCGIVDITTDLGEEDLFDLVICMDVIQYIPEELTNKVVYNLSCLSIKYVLITRLGIEKSNMSDIWIENKFKRFGMVRCDDELKNPIHPIYRNYLLFIHKN